MKKIILFFLFSTSLFAQVPNTLTTADKIYGLSKFWQEVNYNFVYLYKVNTTEWNAKYKELITTIPDTKNDYEYYSELQKFCALLKDGHTQVYLPDALSDKLMFDMFGDYRLFLKPIDGKAIIIGSNLSKKNELPVGSEIIEINGIPIQQYIDTKVAPYISASTDYVRQNQSIIHLLAGLEGDTYVIKIKTPKGKISEFMLVHKITTEKEVFPEGKGQDTFEFKWLKGSIAYVTLNSFENSSIAAQFEEKLPELAKAKGVILDVRNNGGGSSAVAKKIIRHFIDGNVIYGARTYSRLHIPTDKALGSFLQASDTINGKKEWGLDKKETIKLYESGKNNRFHTYEYAGDTITAGVQKIIVPTVILCGNDTASAAEDFLIYADGQKQITKIGQRTNGSTGQPLLIELPGGCSAWICTKKTTYKDGREFVGIGIKPDIEIKKTVDDFLKKRDKALEEATKFILKK